MRIIAVLILINLICLGVVAQDAVITVQKVKHGDWIRQTALINIIQDGESYLIPCPDCSVYITLAGDGITIVNNQSMTQIDNGMWGYRSSSLQNHKYYTARFESVSVTYGSASMYGELYIGDVSEWLGDVVLIPSEREKETTVFQDECSDLDFVPKVACYTQGRQKQFETFKFLGQFEIGIVGTLSFYVYVFFTVIFLLIFEFIGSIYIIIKNLILFIAGLFGFIVGVSDPVTRDASIFDGLMFIFDLLKSLLLPFTPFFVIAEIFIMYQVIKIRSSGGMMIEFFNMNYRMVSGVLKAITTAINAIFGLVKGWI